MSAANASGLMWPNSASAVESFTVTYSYDASYSYTAHEASPPHNPFVVSQTASKSGSVTATRVPYGVMFGTASPDDKFALYRVTGDSTGDLLLAPPFFGPINSLASANNGAGMQWADSFAWSETYLGGSDSGTSDLTIGVDLQCNGDGELYWTLQLYASGDPPPFRSFETSYSETVSATNKMTLDGPAAITHTYSEPAPPIADWDSTPLSYTSYSVGWTLTVTPNP